MKVWRALAVLGLLVGSLAARGDWPMLAHDAARSGTTAEEVRPPFARKWYRLFADEGLQSGVQPVVSRDRLYVGTLAGVLHAIDANTGRDVWTYRAGGPILHAAEAGHQRVFFTCADGKVYCVDADGALRWTYPTGAALWNAPAHDGTDLIVGGRDGTLYAIHPTRGTLTWRATVGAPMLSSPAIDEGRGRVYVGAEDMHVYAFERDTGKPIWRSPKLPGVSFRGYSPVIAPDGSVMITVTPCAGGDAIQQVLLDMTREVFGNFSSWRIKSEEEKKKIRAANFELMKDPATYRKQLDYLTKRLTDEPALQTFFVLDAQTGAPKFVAPVVYAESMNGPAMPPLVTADGKVIVKYNALLRSRYEHYSPFLNVGYLDTKTGFITPVMDQSRTYGWYDSLLLVHDEQSQLMAAGRVLINTHQDNVNAMDLDTLVGYSKPWAQNVHEVEPGVAAGLWARLLHGRDLPTGWEWLPRGTAVYGGGSAIDVPVVVSGDSFYYLPTHEINAGVAIIAYRMDKNAPAEQKVPPAQIMKETITPNDAKKIAGLKWDWDTLETDRLKGTLTGLGDPVPGTDRKPLTEAAKAAVAKIDPKQIEALVLDPPRLAPRPAAPSAHQAKLDAAVLELIAHDWRPLLFPAGKAPAESYRIFTEPAETLYTLALAYPHCSPAVQDKIKARVAVLRAPGGPLSGPLGKDAYDNDQGEIRSFYDEAPAHLLKMGRPITRAAAGRLYPFWLWAYVTGDYASLQHDWPQIQTIVNAKANRSTPDWSNDRLSALIAAARLSKRVDDQASAANALFAAVEMIQLRLADELAHTEGGLIARAGNRSYLARWHYLDPDTARILKAFAGDVHQRLMDVYVDHHRPAWFIAWNTELLWRNESPFSFPDMSADIFAARAMILNEPPDAMAKYLDIPWCKGDEYYVQKLALLAGGAVRN